MIREPRERGVEGQMREAARIDNFVAMDVSVPFRAQDISRTWFDKHLSRIRYFHVNKRWTFLRRNSFFPLPSPPSLSTPPSSAISALVARTERSFDRFNVPTAERTMDPSSSRRLSTQNRRSALHSSHRNVCIYRSEGSPMKAFGEGDFEASNRSVSIHRPWYIYIYTYTCV